MGALIADAMLEAANKVEPGVQIAFMNPGGIRADLVLRENGAVTFGDIFAIQPFGNDLVVMTLTGSEIERVLREMYQPSGNNILQVSTGFTFTWRQATGQPIEIIPGSVKLNGQPLVAGRPYRIVTNNFLAGGGDSFAGFKIGTKRNLIGSDIDALEAYFKAHSPVTPPEKGRVIRVD
jgi:5'-nucleotidase